MQNPNQTNYITAAKHKQENDLVWSLSSPHMLKADFLSSFGSGYLSPCIPARQQPSLIIPRQRLGLYFEQLWEHLISTNFNQTIIAANKQISSDGVTLGALDLLSYSPIENHYFHYEMAVKFYLCASDGQSMTDWIGPNSRDRLDLKLNRLREHQLPLAHKLETREAINRWIDQRQLPTFDEKNLRQYLILKGWLFHHFRSAPIAPNHTFLNHRCPQGQWCRFNEINQWQEDIKEAQHQWLILPKLYWLTPAKVYDSEIQSFSTADLGAALFLKSPILINTNELIKLIEAQALLSNCQALLIAKVTRSGEYWLEQQRIMWVKNHWPESTTNSALPSRNK